MKNSLLISLIGILALTFLSGCGGGGDEGTFPKADDDTVVVEDAYDDHGWKGKIAVTYSNGKISEVDYEEFNKKKEAKSKDEAYKEQMSSASGVTPAEAITQLEKALVSAGSVDGVDTVSGATATSDRFKKLAKEAISKR
jgi:major membrane immunogen (membrane-anchored lipoprotein)